MFKWFNKKKENKTMTSEELVAEFQKLTDDEKSAFFKAVTTEEVTETPEETTEEAEEQAEETETVEETTETEAETETEEQAEETAETETETEQSEETVETEQSGATATDELNARIGKIEETLNVILDKLAEKDKLEASKEKYGLTTTPFGAPEKRLTTDDDINRWLK